MPAPRTVRICCTIPFDSFRSFAAKIELAETDFAANQDLPSTYGWQLDAGSSTRAEDSYFEGVRWASSCLTRRSNASCMTERSLVSAALPPVVNGLTNRSARLLVATYYKP